MSIYFVSYGRIEFGVMFCFYKGVESDKDYNCGESNVIDIFKMLCERKNRCRVKVYSVLFWDFCLEKLKKYLYFILIYMCGKCLIYIYLNGSESYNLVDVKYF